MGEGKSSVIIPIAAAALADGKQLVRVIVPKALAVQMFDLLVARLGGLTRYAPDSIQHESNQPGSFPHIRVTQVCDIGRRLISLITEDMIAG